jgi:hypothetical protein
MPSRVFVSSVIEGFSEYRAAARQGIEASNATAVLVNEDFPALAVSSRNACLDAVDSCDIYIAIVGERGGWRTPSGRLVVEEEYERARQRKMPILAFIQRVPHDEDARRLVERLSNYVDGTFRRTFTTPHELRREIESALVGRPNQYMVSKHDAAVIQDRLKAPCGFRSEAGLRFVLAPERSEELLDIVALDSQDFKQGVFELGHDSRVRLLSFERPKELIVNLESVIIEQSDSAKISNSEEVRLEITTRGIITIDANVTGRVTRGQPYDLFDGFSIVEGDIVTVLRSSFAFCSELFARQDPYKRHERFFYNVSLSGIGYRKLVADPDPKRSITFEIDRKEAVPAFDAPRLISRSDLEAADGEIGRVLTLFRRRLTG